MTLKIARWYANFYKLMDGDISPINFHPMKERTEKTLAGFEHKLRTLKKRFHFSRPV
jgi:hypothetical protein